jgi:glycosyltransferase involved in cell wall biosynthesis
VKQYSVAPENVTVIPLAPVTALTPAGDGLAWLPANYMLYPAAFWPHKNHARLLEALRVLRESHGDAELVLTGDPVEAGTDVAARAAALGLSDYVHIAGFLSESDLATVYSHARLVVVPTLFEAASFPIWEAFSRGVPVACSTVTALPRQVADAAVLFDPLDVNEMAAAITRAWSDAELRTSLVARGAARVAEFSWAETARRFVALYRVLTGVETSADVALLAETPKL